MKKTILLIAVAIAMLWLGSSLDKEVMLQDCVSQTDATDTDCEECYVKIYGHNSND